MMNMGNEHGHRKGTQVPLLLLLLSGCARALTPSVRAPWHLQHAAAALPARVRSEAAAAAGGGVE